MNLHRLMPFRLHLVVLLGTLLVGVQWLQASPLHHHSGHSVVDCSIGHLPSVDVPLAQVPQAVAQPALFHPCTEAQQQHPGRRRVAPYQGRAPPLLSR